MSMAIATSIAIFTTICCMNLNMPPNEIVIVLAIIVAGGLAGMKD